MTEKSDHMDPADAHRALANQGAMHGRHDQAIEVFLNNIAVLSQSMNELTQHMAHLMSTWAVWIKAG